MGIKKRMLDPVSVESSCYNSYPLFSFAVSAVGTRIGRRTSSRRATSDAGGARLSEAGESDQLTERGREKEKHEFHEHRAFFATFSFSFFFFFFFRDIRFDNRTSFPSYFPIIILLYFLRIEGRVEDSTRRIRMPLLLVHGGKNRWKNKGKWMEKKYHPTLRIAVPLFSSSPLLSSRPILEEEKFVRLLLFL